MSEPRIKTQEWNLLRRLLFHHTKTVEQFAHPHILEVSLESGLILNSCKSLLKPISVPTAALTDQRCNFFSAFIIIFYFVPFIYFFPMLISLGLLWSFFGEIKSVPLHIRIRKLFIYQQILFAFSTNSIHQVDHTHIHKYIHTFVTLQIRQFIYFYLKMNQVQQQE